MKKIYLLLHIVSLFQIAFIIFLVPKLSFGQNLLNSKQTSHFSYIYKITDLEAEVIYTSGEKGIKESFFHTLIDSFPMSEEYQGDLPDGHYLKTFALKNRQRIEITSIQPVRIFIIKNDRDLNIQVYGPDEKIIKKAEVSADGKKLTFDPKTESYQDKKSNKSGVVKVTYAGKTSFFFLEKKLNNSTFKITKNNILYGTPIRYVWIPVRFVLLIPVDGYKSIKTGYVQGSIYKISDFFQRAYHSTACIFDDYHCDWRDYSSYESHLKGYMVFDKPKYKPLDTLNMKSYLVNKRGKPYTNEVELELYQGSEKKYSTTVQPFREGAFSYSLHLHDSLKLKLDQYAQIRLLDKNKDELMSRNLEIEEYELKRNSLEISLSSDIHVRGKEQILTLSAKDENGLRIKDGRVQIWVFPHHPKIFHDSIVFLPDTLQFIERELLTNSPTEIAIPDSIFPMSDLDYAIKTVLLNAENERLEENISGFFKAFDEPFSMMLENDSLSVKYNNPKESSEKILLFGRDYFGNKELVESILPPFRIPFNTLISEYIVECSGKDQVFSVAEESAKVSVVISRNPEELTFAIQNPRKVPVTYFLYYGNNLVQSGQQPSQAVRMRNKGEKNYFLSLNYLWAGEIQYQTYQIPLQKYRLQINSQEPVLIYPGEETEIQIEVKDYKNRPVEGVDLTAFGLTKKFNFEAPSLPSLGKSPKGKKLINNFTITNTKPDLIERPLNYPAWKILASLDSISYFQFIYPESKLYRFEHPTESGLTQFSPFILKNGNFEPVSVIYVDKVPVYFYWNTIQQPYSFLIDPGYRQLKFRLEDQIITLDSVYFEANKRTIISIDPSLYKGKMNVEEAELEFSQTEKNHLYNYIFPYRNPFIRGFSYLKTDKNVINLGLGNGPNSKKTYLAGPVYGFLDFKLINGFTTGFHHEPYYEYDFREGLLKMRSLNEYILPTQSSRVSISNPLGEQVMTEEKLFELWQSHLEKLRIEKAQYINPNNTTKGRGRLELGFDKQLPMESLPINVLIFNQSNLNDIRIYPGSAKVFHDLKPGKYEVFLLFKGSSYSKIDSIEVLKDGLNFVKVPFPISSKKDAFSQKLVQLIEKNLFNDSPSDLLFEQRELVGFQRTYLENNKYSGPGILVSGYIVDETGFGLPGATVIVEGLAHGASTNLDGYYELVVPYGYSELVVSFVGYKSTNFRISQGIPDRIQMEPDVRALSEVIVTGYGVMQTKRTLSYATTVVDAEFDFEEVEGMLQGRVAGVAIQDAGKGVNLQIRGMSSVNFQEKPLILIDGKVFLGELNLLDLTQAKKVESLLGEEAFKRFGEKGKNGAILIYFQEEKINDQTQDEGLDWENAGGGKIRNNFSDVAFWQPDLITDEEGKASFKVKFPDDITAWQTHVLAMNGKKQNGKNQGLIRSYMPVVAQLFIPRFLITNDTARILGKSLNYMGDSLEVETGFEINGNPTLPKRTGILTDIRVDSLTLVSKDSLKIQYQLQTKKGFKDGEIREIPVFPQGMSQTKGHFGILEADTVFTLITDTSAMASKLTFWSDLSGIYEEELAFIHSYRYLCNEQMASKVKALLLQRDLDFWKSKPFEQEKVLRKLITSLQRNQQSNGMWGWWNDSGESLWITLHVVEALGMAQEKGFEAGFSKPALEEVLLRYWDKEKDFETKSKIIHAFISLRSQVGFTRLMEDLEKTKKETVSHDLGLLWIKSRLNQEISINELDKYQRNSILGNTYYGSGLEESNWQNGDIALSLLAYKILKNNQDTPDSVLRSIRNYLFEKREKGNWINTYLSSRVLETLIPEMVKESKFAGNQSVMVKGDIDASISKFPFIEEFNATQPLIIRKTGNLPLYYSYSENFWNPNPDPKKGAFEITTRFEENNGNLLKAGTEVALMVEVRVKEDASFVMINVPIPGGCSYGKKSNRSNWETHREYFLEETAIFCENLPKGNHTFRISLEPRFTGTYTLNPAKIEMMYFPTINANEGLKKVRIED
ncbi:carboxypeptidase-like regulatory domain-containing protein [Aquiflexum gelatinilyticum]|uniref:carboxypeptidase-like regulatory domain-containing protein n=1 Tax=Aquiflexum gelatinilyticum TaxID=2961943 RepID=UPI002167249C|nr:carboxypeptidase-like regulatory domain-containing protein [Aquiflexum gelatinilyticum]